jgi:urease accessory protein UreE
MKFRVYVEKYARFWVEIEAESRDAAKKKVEEEDGDETFLDMLEDKVLNSGCEGFEVLAVTEDK